MPRLSGEAAIVWKFVVELWERTRRGEDDERESCDDSTTNTHADDDDAMFAGEMRVVLMIPFSRLFVTIFFIMIHATWRLRNPSSRR